MSELEFSVPFQHKHGYIRDERTQWVKRPKDLKLYTLLHRQRIDDQQLGLLLTCITGCKRQANTLLKSADCAHCREQKAAAFVLRLMKLHQMHGVNVRLKTIVTLSHTAAMPETKHV